MDGGWAVGGGVRRAPLPLFIGFVLCRIFFCPFLATKLHRLSTCLIRISETNKEKGREMSQHCT